MKYDEVVYTHKTVIQIETLKVWTTKNKNIRNDLCTYCSVSKLVDLSLVDQSPYPSL